MQLAISTVLEVNAKFDNLGGKLCRTLEDIQARLLDQIKALDLKLQEFEAVDKLMDQIKETESKIQGSKVVSTFKSN